MTLKDYIKSYRDTHGISQRQFAIKCNLSNGYISMLESGVNPKTKQPIIPTLIVLKKLAEGMSISVDSLLANVDDMPVTLSQDDRNTSQSERDTHSPQLLPSSTIPIDPSKWHQIPILGRISAGLPLYAEQHIEGYTLTDLNGDAEYFALRVHGDSMNAIGINDGYLIIVRRQEDVENGEVAVVMVGDNDATVKRFYAAGDTVTLLPQSTNPSHKPQIYDTKYTSIRILGKVKKVEFSI